MKPLTAHELVAVMKAAAEIAEDGTKSIKVRRAARKLRDSAFCKFVWGE